MTRWDPSGDAEGAPCVLTSVRRKNRSRVPVQVRPAEGACGTG